MNSHAHTHTHSEWTIYDRSKLQLLLPKIDDEHENIEKKWNEMKPSPLTKKKKRQEQQQQQKQTKRRR